jgi:hypothetical protein
MKSMYVEAPMNERYFNRCYRSPQVRHAAAMGEEIAGLVWWMWRAGGRLANRLRMSARPAGARTANR